MGNSPYQDQEICAKCLDKLEEKDKSTMIESFMKLQSKGTEGNKINQAFRRALLPDKKTDDKQNEEQTKKKEKKKKKKTETNKKKEKKKKKIKEKAIKEKTKKTRRTKKKKE